jgi:hypothetical protein
MQWQSDWTLGSHQAPTNGVGKQHTSLGTRYRTDSNRGGLDKRLKSEPAPASAPSLVSPSGGHRAHMGVTH